MGTTGSPLPSAATPRLANPAAPRPWAAPLDRLAFGLLLMTLLWAPWPLGSNRPWAVAVLGALLACGFLLACVARLGLQGAAPAPRRAAAWWLPPLALAGFALLLVVQLVPGLLAHSTAGGGTISADPFATRRYLFTTLVYALAWGLVLLTVTQRQRAAQLLLALVVAGALQATAAVLLGSTNWRYELLFAEFDQSGRATGTFVNPDHLAGYMELALSAGLGWLLSQFSPQDAAMGRGWQARLSVVLEFVLSPKMLLRLTLVVVVIALVMTHSRMGNGAFFLALLLVGAVVAARSPRLRKPALWLVASMAFIDLLIIGQWVGLDRVVQRMRETAQVTVATARAPEGEAPVFGSNLPTERAPTEESLQQRMEVPTLSLQLVQQRPWLGHGGGSYVTVFPPYKQEGLPNQWDHAHNDYVQVASDTGLVGLLLWLTAGLASGWRAWQLLDDRESATNRGFAVAALMALCCMGLHSMVDFNLHIPANALTFTVLLAAVWAVEGSGKRTRSGTRPSTRSHRPRQSAE